MKPLPAPLLRRQIDADPLNGAVGEAMHDATVQLWADLWQRLEKYDESADRLISICDRIDRCLSELPWFVNKTRIKRRLARARADLMEVRCGRP